MKSPLEIVVTEYQLALVKALEEFKEQAPEVYEEIAKQKKVDAFILAELLAVWRVFPDKTFAEIARIRSQGGVCSRFHLHSLIWNFYPKYLARKAVEKFPEINDTTKKISSGFRRYAETELHLRSAELALGEYWVCDVDKVKSDFVEEYEVAVKTKTTRRYRMRGTTAADAREAFLRLSSEEREEFFAEEDEPIVSVDVDLSA